MSNDKTSKNYIQLEGHNDAVNCIAFSPDGKLLASGSDDKTIIVWKVENRRKIWHLEGSKKHGINSVAFSSDGRLLASGGFSGLWLWDVNSGRKLRFIDQGAKAIAFSPTGKILAMAHANEIIFRDINSGVEPKYLDEKMRIPPGSEEFSEELHQQVDAPKLKGHTSDIRSIAFSPNKLLLVSGSLDKTIRIWDAVTYKEISCITGHTDWVNSVVLSPDGKFIVSGSNDCTMRVWELESCKEIRRFEEFNLVDTVAFSHDGSRIASSCYNTIGVWELASGQEILRLEGHNKTVPSVTFSSDGKFIASGSEDSTVRLWRISSDAEPEKESSKRCFIATAVYGSNETVEVQILRHFRGKILMHSQIGKAFILIYNKISPSLAVMISRSNTLSSMVRRIFLDPVVRFIYRKYYNEQNKLERRSYGNN